MAAWFLNVNLFMRFSHSPNALLSLQTTLTSVSEHNATSSELQHTTIRKAGDFSKL